MEDIALTIEQMQYISSFGVNTKDASMGYFYYGDYGTNYEPEYHLEPTNGNGFDLKHGDVPAYTLSDLIQKMPRIRTYLPYDLHMCANNTDEKPDWMSVFEPFNVNDKWIKFTDKSPLQSAYKMYIHLLKTFGDVKAHQWYQINEPINEPNDDPNDEPINN